MCFYENDDDNDAAAFNADFEREGSRITAQQCKIVRTGGWVWGVGVDTAEKSTQRTLG